MIETTTRKGLKLSHFLQNNDPIAYINNTIPFDAYPSSTPLPYLQKAANSMDTYIIEVSVTTSMSENRQKMGDLHADADPINQS